MSISVILPQYIILTDGDILDTPIEELLIQQEEALRGLGFNEDVYYNTSFNCHYFNSRFFNECDSFETIADAIQGLAIKDGVDLVQFTNGNIGFVADGYTHPNGFEITDALFKVSIPNIEPSLYADISEALTKYHIAKKYFRDASLEVISATKLVKGGE